MALTLTPPPGTYTTDQTVTISGSGVQGVILSTDGSDPVVVSTVTSSNKYAPTEYPYIQTIEDGRGRAVFDGAFAKYYNSLWSAQSPTPTGFSTLDPQFKFLWNVLDFILNGGTKVLAICDASANYPIVTTQYLMDTGPSGFLTTFTQIAALKGIQLTAKSGADYPNSIASPSFNECMSYDAIVFLGTCGTAANTYQMITPSGAANIAQARRSGKGLYIVTDNGGAASGNPSRYPELFTQGPNQLLAAVTNASFDGNMDFSPGTTVGYNKAKYGDSPLFNGLSDTDVIFGSTSDSFVNQPASVLQPLPITIPITSGYTAVKMAVVDTGGNTTFEQYGYNVGQPPIIELVDEFGVTITAWDETILPYRDVYFKYLPGTFGNATGFITVNGVVVGSFADAVGGELTPVWQNSAFSAVAHPNRIFTDGAVDYPVVVELTDPVPFIYTFEFNRYIPDVPRDLGKFCGQLNRLEFATNPPTTAKILRTVFQKTGVTKSVGTLAPSSVTQAAWDCITTSLKPQ